jgi:Eukaryotic cytochrome b561
MHIRVWVACLGRERVMLTRRAGARRDTLKLIHIGFHTVAVIAFSAGLTAIVRVKIYTGVYHFYTAHSWVGIIVIFLSVLQVRRLT